MHALLDVARDAITARLRGGRIDPPALKPPWNDPKPVFVTLHHQDKLRGCIGSLRATRPTLADEVAWAASAAAFEDPRFPPVTEEELDGLTLEISVLQPAEPVTDLSALDPDRYGVIVQSGMRRGVLLPAIDAVRTVNDQLSIARRKARIAANEEYAISRFEVLKLTEED